MGERIKEQTEKKRKRDNNSPEDDRDSTLNNSRSAVAEEQEYQEKRIKLEKARGRNKTGLPTIAISLYSSNGSVSQRPTCRGPPRTNLTPPR